MGRDGGPIFHCDGPRASPLKARDPSRPVPGCLRGRAGSPEGRGSAPPDLGATLWGRWPASRRLRVDLLPRRPMERTPRFGQRSQGRRQGRLAAQVGRQVTHRPSCVQLRLQVTHRSRIPYFG
jgi:hypothetical protein